MKSILKNFAQKENGSISIIAAFIMVTLLTFCAITTDLGIAYMQKQSLQNAVDSAALAGASMLPNRTLAENTARDYVQKNGFSRNDITVSFAADDKSLKVEGTKKVGFFFARTFNVDSFDLGSKAGAKKENSELIGPFSYRIFSGSDTANFNIGGTVNIHGSIHSNGGLSVSPGNGNITGNVEARTSLFVNDWTTTVGGSKIFPAPRIDMIQIDDIIESIMPVNYYTVLNASIVNSISTKQFFTGTTKIVGNVSISNQAVVNGDLYVEGDLVINGGAPVLVLNGNIYATGKITFNNSFIGNGCLFANGNISFNGGGAQLTSDKTLGIYSKTGNINFCTSSSTVRGIIYAPLGTVTVVGGTTTFYGSIIGNEISGIPSRLTMYPPDFDPNYLPKDYKVSLIE